MAEQEALFPIRSLISHILTFLVSFVFVSSSFITSGIYYLEHNYLEKFQIPSTRNPQLATRNPPPLVILSAAQRSRRIWPPHEIRFTRCEILILLPPIEGFGASPERFEENPLPSEFTLNLGVYPEQGRREGRPARKAGYKEGKSTWPS